MVARRHRLSPSRHVYLLGQTERNSIEPNPHGATPSGAFAIPPSRWRVWAAAAAIEFHHDQTRFLRPPSSRGSPECRPSPSRADSTVFWPPTNPSGAGDAPGEEPLTFTGSPALVTGRWVRTSSPFVLILIHSAGARLHARPCRWYQSTHIGWRFFQLVQRGDDVVLVLKSNVRLYFGHQSPCVIFFTGVAQVTLAMVLRRGIGELVEQWRNRCSGLLEAPTALRLH
jgi:hypothetical protein